MADNDFDLAIIGGGVNGCGVARDAAGRGARVVLFEQGDLAGATSSASTKLIHGGLRYLEFYKFRLVREALGERAVLWGMAPHLTQPLRFVLPHHKELRPRWMLRVGLWLYDHLGSRGGLPAARSLDLRRDPAGVALKSQFSRGFSYYDCRTDDARLVVLNARDAADRGAQIRRGVRVVGAERVGDVWRLDYEDVQGRRGQARARGLVNAAGPWVNDALRLTGASIASKVRLVQGSHLVTKRLYDDDAAFIFQNKDGRVLFVIPWLDDFTMIGTTDRDWRGPPEAITASEEEIQYMLGSVNGYLRRQVDRSEVISTWSGVRALVDDGADEAREATRDYSLVLDAPEGQAPLVSIYGGKITTYRRLAEAVLTTLGPHLAAVNRPAWTRAAALPGGDFPKTGLDALTDAVAARYPFLAPAHTRRLAHTYGTLAFQVLGDSQRLEDLGRLFGSSLSAKEVDYLMDREWAQTAEDVLHRRTKLYLHTNADDAAALEDYMARRDRPHTAASASASVSASASASASA